MSQNQRGGMILAIKIDVMKITKDRLFQGKNGAKYLDAVIFIDNEKGQFGDNGMIVEDISKEDKDAGQKGTILGNCRIIRGEVVGDGQGTAQQMRPPMQQATPVNRGATNRPAAFPAAADDDTPDF